MENPLRAAALNCTETRPLCIVSSEPVPTMALLSCLVENILLSAASQLNPSLVPLALRPQVKWIFGAGLLGISMTSGALFSLSCSNQLAYASQGSLEG